jgi:guanylate kinase
MEILPQKVDRGFVLAVSAPSGTGKTSLCDRLAEEHAFVVRSISATTRPKRDGEMSGKDYIFLTPDEFKSKEKGGEFIETAQVFHHWYGTPRSPVDKAVADGKVIVMDIDTVGAFNIRKIFPQDSVLLFVLPPSLKELEKRLRQRGKNSATELEFRLSEASREVSEAHRYDYLIHNDHFEEAYGQLKAIVMAERLRAWRLSPLF